MSYVIEHSRNSNLEDTTIPNLFIEKILPDVPDGDFLKVYIYAYMCCKQNLHITHFDLSEKLGISIDRVIAAWKYFESRKIVRVINAEKDGDLNFDVEFVDIKGMLFVRDNGASKKSLKKAAEKFDDIQLKSLFSNIANICNSPSFDGDDAKKVYKWMASYEATPEIIEAAYVFSRDTKDNTNTDYVGKIVKSWSSKGLKTKKDVDDYLVATDERHSFYKNLMAALGVKYMAITEAEKKIINTWLDEDGFTQMQLLEFAEKTAGASGNRLRYMGGIIKNEKEKAGLVAHSVPRKGSSAERSELYRKRREACEAQAEANIKEVYGAVPAIAKLDEEIMYLNVETMKVLSSSINRKEEAVARLKKNIETKIAEKDRLMEKAGFPQDYTDVKYVCDKCKDNGVLENGTACDCLDAS